MKRRYLIGDNKDKVGNIVLYADYLEYREGNALFWENPPEGKRLIGLFSLKQWHIIDETNIQ